jgi:glutamyl-Q tRNA(Asp) synthetase
MTEKFDHSPPSSSNTPSSSYIGRFAPSPSGPLHLGSLVAALASWLDARQANGRWLLRMEDLDPPRESCEAADSILFALDSLGLNWDGPVLYQSSRYAAYREAIGQLQAKGLVFACDCTRQHLQDYDGIYPGTCRNRNLLDGEGLALRCIVADHTIAFSDALQGYQSQHLADAVGDFIIRRKDGLFAYQLAVVVDDAFQGVTHVVRGIDLLDSTARQIYLQQQLSCPTPCYAHIPVIINDQGQKLSKQHMAEGIKPEEQGALLYSALLYLQQNPDPDLQYADAKDVLDWAIEHWSPLALTNLKTLTE